eukprot:3941970-Rhodomonas_salina.9
MGGYRLLGSKLNVWKEGWYRVCWYRTIRAPRHQSHRRPGSSTSQSRTLHSKAHDQYRAFHGIADVSTRRRLAYDMSVPMEHGRSIRQGSTA